mmetsp:Transcript_23168/g.34314  ORF Transcript_23168/g.34314 Transcript_23168/m.34314 type:complete len:307 (-) Transcript_23168:264-1184(-)|eukprot:CAMPEP_0194053310 /NCGR_PEP_ID=MMETSP0009_2-20130614/49231_1 /TAXON_ID=210454 /ORGANISM="Grammatophora oceanica, Strain CCMP 410" /LENGTH=306 /DNA_ID=CAMNT_0038701327 /DNA_START=48 /DNA_END=968 /DNA_ORIENTATION=-
MFGDDIEADVPRDMPAPSSWKDQPLCLWDRANNRVCPIGKPVDFETPLFRGKLLVRVKTPHVDDPYFDGRRRKHQYVVQGQFKEEVNVLDLIYGTQYERPMRSKPPSFFYPILKAFLTRANPGLEMDLVSDKPFVLQNIGCAVQQLLIHEEGEKVPDIEMIENFEDRTQAFGGKFDAKRHGCAVGPSKRKNIFAQAKRGYDAGHRCKHEYVFEPSNTYTFVFYEDKTDLFAYTQNLGLVTIDLARVTHAEPVQLMCLSKAHNMQAVFDFQIWHTKLFQKLEGSGVFTKDGLEISNEKSASYAVPRK